MPGGPSGARARNRCAGDLTASALPEARASVTKSAMPAELLRLAGGALRDHDVDEGGARETHRLVEGAAQVLRILDKEALAAEGGHYLVIAGAVNQCVGLQIEHRTFRDLRHAGADAAIVQDDDLGREVVTDQRLHLHARKADCRIP